MKDNNQENIEVQLLNINGDVKLYEDVNYIKIVNKKYNLIIMRDYLPIIGEINGKVEIVMNKEAKSIKMDKVKGYFMHKHNKFKLFYLSQN